MKEYVGEEETPTWEKWRSNLVDGYLKAEKGERPWILIGEWLINAKENAVYTNESVAYHVCKENYNKLYNMTPDVRYERYKQQLSSISDIEERCLMCKTPVPDGIKMIALLEKL